MPINASIPLGVNPLQLPQQDPNQGMNALARMMQLKGMQDDQQVNALRMQDMQRTSERRNKLDSLLGGFSGKPEELESSLLRGGFLDEAGKVGKDRRENQQLDTKQKQMELEMGLKKAQHASSVLSLAKDPQSYATVRAVVKAQFGQDLPEQFDPAMVQALVAQGQTITERLAAEHQRLTLAETGRHNVVTEGETGRHNKASEGIQFGQLKETGRHNSTMEGYRGQEVAQGAIKYERDASGNLVALPTKPGAGPIQARPVTGPGGQPLPTRNEVAAKRTFPILDQAESLIDQATGSYAGAGVDQAGRFFGQSTKGADAIAQLKVLEGQLMMAQPRMEGPQSDKDVAMYRQMAGQIGDPTVPPDMKKAALKTIRNLQEQYAGGAQPTTPKPSGAPTRISSDAEYNSLPKGAEFIAPDGSHRRKP